MHFSQSESTISLKFSYIKAVENWQIKPTGDAKADLEKMMANQ